MGLAPATDPGAGDVDPAALRKLHFDDSAKAALRGTLKAALRVGHNYVGTEHLLLGVLFADGDTARDLIGLGITVDVVESAIAAEVARIRTERRRAG